MEGLIAPLYASIATAAGQVAPAFQSMAFDLAGIRIEKPAEKEKSGGLFGFIRK